MSRFGVKEAGQSLQFRSDFLMEECTSDLMSGQCSVFKQPLHCFRASGTMKPYTSHFDLLPKVKGSYVRSAAQDINLNTEANWNVVVNVRSTLAQLSEPR